MSEVTVESIREAAKQHEEDGRHTEAKILRVILADIEQGIPWLELMNGGGLA